MNNTIVQPSLSVPPISNTPPLVEGSIVAAIAIYIIKESISFFKQKDASDEKLTATLIEDLRSHRSNELRQQGEMIAQMKMSHDKIALAIEKMSAATADINQALQQSKRTETEIFHALRQNHECLLLLNEKLDRLTGS